MIHSVISVSDIHQLQLYCKILHTEIFQHIHHISLLVGSGMIGLLNGTPQALRHNIVKMLVTTSQAGQLLPAVFNPSAHRLWAPA